MAERRLKRPRDPIQLAKGGCGKSRSGRGGFKLTHYPGGGVEWPVYPYPLIRSYPPHVLIEHAARAVRAEAAHGLDDPRPNLFPKSTDVAPAA